MIDSLNGDYNPLHASPEAGKGLGYQGIIIHGLFSWNVVAQTVMKHYAETTLISFEARFASPVKPMDKLDISLWDMGLLDPQQLSEWNREQKREDVNVLQSRVREIRFLVKVAETVVLTDGRALLDESDCASRERALL